jgi:hypothetical protein
MDIRPAHAAHWDAGETLADRFRAHAGDSEHLYGHAMRVSITQMYWAAVELAAVEAILASCRGQRWVGEVGLEFDLAGPQVAEPVEP